MQMKYLVMNKMQVRLPAPRHQFPSQLLRLPRRLRHRDNLQSALHCKSVQFRTVPAQATLVRLGLGNGLNKVADKVFRIGHLGDMNDLMLLATLAGVESGLALHGVPIERGGVQAAMGSLEAEG